MAKYASLDESVKNLHQNMDNILISYNIPKTEEILQYNTTDVWFSVNSSLESGTGMIMFYLNTLTMSKGWVKLSKNAKAKLHFHNSMTEQFVVLHGSLGYTTYEGINEVEIESGILEPGESVIFEPDVWHTIYTALEDTYLEIIITKHNHG